VETKVLNQSVKRNVMRFPKDFMFQLTETEVEFLRSQFVTLNNSQNKVSKRGAHRKYLPYVFTEHGVLMLSSVLKSERAVSVNIQIVRTFIKLREMLSKYKDLKEKIEDIEKKYDHRFKVVFDTLKQLIKEEEKPKNKIGFSEK
jgi:phage regulator Rha-like protein